MEKNKISKESKSVEIAHDKGVNSTNLLYGGSYFPPSTSKSIADYKNMYVFAFPRPQKTNIKFSLQVYKHVDFVILGITDIDRNPISIRATKAEIEKFCENILSAIN
ncbi:MAG: hypothetical protein K8F52_13460 [Candidatus Scalindua rubra]|uniref:Uncharacterized protein n=1 Tax=Candidatus Scalindua brodae TaxID=237368 RepID=A0A0B0EQC2_9BACT|nr:MAG: hypothetical protein SCABRO_00159 [Candidatus Scalindua brodae]MBZ0109667.1 hypothetical protein [Candidatus Scalindua rubra]